MGGYEGFSPFSSIPTPKIEFNFGRNWIFCRTPLRWEIQFRPKLNSILGVVLGRNRPKPSYPPTPENSIFQFSEIQFWASRGPPGASVLSLWWLWDCPCQEEGRGGLGGKTFLWHLRQIGATARDGARLTHRALRQADPQKHAKCIVEPNCVRGCPWGGRRG